MRERCDLRLRVRRHAGERGFRDERQHREIAVELRLDASFGMRLHEVERQRCARRERARRRRRSPNLADGRPRRGRPDPARDACGGRRRRQSRMPSSAPSCRCRSCHSRRSTVARSIVTSIGISSESGIERRLVVGAFRVDQHALRSSSVVDREPSFEQRARRVIEHDVLDRHRHVLVAIDDPAKLDATEQRAARLVDRRAFRRFARQRNRAA